MPTGAPNFEHDRYQPGEVLGAGAQGVVFRVVDRESPSRALVAKLWRPGLFGDEALSGEFALLARLRVPGLVRAHDLGRERSSGAPFLVEDFVDGPDAVGWVGEASGAARGVRLGRLMGEVATTLSALHDAGFLHGDLKPAHVRVTATEGAVLLDLGAAVPSAREAGDAGALAVSPGFAAPELLAGGRPRPASDLYGLGALAWAVAAGSTPPPRASRPPLRRLAPWVPPSLAELIEQLLAEHPSDRPASARELLERLGGALPPGEIGRAAAPGGQGAFGRVGATVGRERELAALSRPWLAPVRYLVGPSGAGKSHLAREAMTRALLEGRPARLLVFPDGDTRALPGLLAYLRGSPEAFPYGSTPGGAPLLLVLDQLHRAPPELVAALDAHRVLWRGPRRAELLATAREAPPGAEVIEVGSLGEGELRALARSAGEQDEDSAGALVRASAGNPGWLLASLGRVPLTAEAIDDRLAGLSTDAKALFAAMAVAGGELRASWARALVGEGLPDEAGDEAVSGGAGGKAGDKAGDVAGDAAGDEARARKALAELLSSGLAGRRASAGAVTYSLGSEALASEVARKLAGEPPLERLSRVLLADAEAPSRALLSAARAPLLGEGARRALLGEAAKRARASGLRGDEIEALFALSAEPGWRSAGALLRLERLTRDAGLASSYPQVLGWLDEAARAEPSALSLVLRRKAEKAAREGDHAGAEALASRALEASRAQADGQAEAFSLATLGAVALFRADWPRAHQALREARRALAALPHVDDAEEAARLDHNLGVVAVYRGQIDEAVEAFRRSTSAKQRLGDRAGVRASLRNLGYALTRAGKLDEAASSLDEAISLAISLGQAAGRAWCLSARAEVEIRRGDARSAERFIAEAEALGEAVAAAVAADLVVLRAEACVLEGDGRRALEHLGRLPPTAREGDALVDARALIVEGRARLALLPAEPRKAAVAAVAAARRSRAAGLPEPEAQALALLRDARGRRPRPTPDAMRNHPTPSLSPSPHDEALWAWLARLGSGALPGRPSGEPAGGHADEAAGETSGDEAGRGGGEAGEAAVDLCRLALGCSGAERAFVALALPDGSISRAWAVDLDGLPLGEAEKRAPRAAVAASLASPGALYQRAVATAAGEGSRLAIAAADGAPSGRAVLVLEHRFVPGRFDALAPSLLAKLATLAQLAARLATLERRPPRPAAHGDPTRLVAHGGPPEAQAPPRSPPAASPLPPSGTASGVFPGATTLQPLARARRGFPTIVGGSPSLKRALARLDLAVDSDLPVLVVGETGAGKELFARAVHDHGPRSSQPFVAVNCAAIADSLFEAEVFGHARGAFTGADRPRAGLIARAEGGTLFLDEIGELSPARQASLLRVLETRRYRPVGSDEERESRARIVAATNRDLDRAVDEGLFRRDLLFRLDVLRIRVPSLRERPDDVAPLCRSFLDRAGCDAEIAPAALSALEAYAWPGNVRELEHQMQRLAAQRLGRVELAHLPREIRGSQPDPRSRPPPEPDDERAEVERALDVSSGNISHAARLLGLTRHGLKKRMLRLGLRERADQKTSP